MTFGKENKLYRSRDGKLLGVCKGIAQWLGWPAAIVRVILIAIALMTAVIPTLLIYLLAAVILTPEPKGESWGEDNFYRNCRFAWRDFRDNVEHGYRNFRRSTSKQ